MTPESTSHPDLDTLADLAEGLFDEATTAELTAHVEACPQCAANARRLGEVTSLLATAPVEAMPPWVSARVTAAIREAASDAPHSDRSVRGLPSQRRLPAASTRWPRWSRVPLAAAAAALLVFAGVIGVDHLSANHSAVRAGGGSSNRSDTPSPSGSRGHTPRSEAPRFNGPSLTHSTPPGGTGSGQANSAFSQSRLPAQTRELLAATVDQGTSGGTPSAPTDNGPMTGSHGSLPSSVSDVPGASDCVADGVRSGELPIAAEDGTYEGQSALLLVYGDAAQGPVDGLLVATPCVPEHIQILDTVTVTP